MSDAIALAASDPSWPAAYAAARDEVQSLLPNAPRLIEHIGSTAVPGLPAKPVIDIIALVDAMPPVLAAMPQLQRAGYEFRPAVSNAERLFLRRYGADGERTHHLHIHTDDNEVRRHILFRDRLRADPDIRRDYLALKQRLAVRHQGDREAYARGKDGFVDAVVLASGGPPRRAFWNS